MKRPDLFGNSREPVRPCGILPSNGSEKAPSVDVNLLPPSSYGRGCWPISDIILSEYASVVPVCDCEPPRGIALVDENGDRSVGDVLPMAILDELLRCNAGVAETILAGEESPLVVEQRPPELVEPSLRALKSGLLGRESGVSVG